MAREGAVRPIENRSKPWCQGKQVPRIRPPDPTHGVTIDIRSRREPTIRLEQAHIVEQLCSLQPSAGRDPRALQRRNRKPVTLERRRPGGNPSAADPARGVVQNRALRFGLHCQVASAILAIRSRSASTRSNWSLALP
jgi:hypothetical protein